MYQVRISQNIGTWNLNIPSAHGGEVKVVMNEAQFQELAFALVENLSLELDGTQHNKDIKRWIMKRQNDIEAGAN
jgi:hypothetical protein